MVGHLAGSQITGVRFPLGPQMNKNGSFCIIVSGEEILLFHRDNKPGIPYPNHWQLPGGGLEENETWVEGMARELKEEVSFCPENLHLIGFHSKDGSKTALFMSYVENKSVFKLGPGEGQEIGFFNVENAKKLELTPVIRYRLNTHETIIRQHIKNKTIIKASDIGCMLT